jgi:hypothetical protein
MPGARGNGCPGGGVGTIRGYFAGSRNGVDHTSRHHDARGRLGRYAFKCRIRHLIYLCPSYRPRASMRNAAQNTGNLRQPHQTKQRADAVIRTRNASAAPREARRREIILGSHRLAPPRTTQDPTPETQTCPAEKRLNTPSVVRGLRVPAHGSFSLRNPLALPVCGLRSASRRPPR